MRGLAESVLTAWALGAAAGLAALGAEAMWADRALNVGGAIGYSLLGGMSAAAARLLLGWGLGVSAARLGAIASLGSFGSLYAMYFVNVKVLPLDDLFSPKSLVLDAAILALAVSVALALVRSTRLRRTRDRWRHPLSVLGLILLIGSLSSFAWYWPRDSPRGTPSGASGPNLILLVVDSARRDHLGFHGYPRPTSPRLDAAAPIARVYDAAFAASAWTVPTMRALLRSESPSTLVDELRRRGYASACFSDNPNLSPRSPLLSGFQRVERSVGRWRDFFAATVVGEAIERLDPGDDIRLVERALSWAATAPEPFFLYVHLMDAHAPFRRPPIDGKRRGGRRIVFPASTQGLTPEEVEDVIARYDAGIRSSDEAAGRLLDAAASWRRPYVAIVTADHGESLGESGRWFHGGALAPELLAVPLLVLGDGVEAGRVREPIAHAAITTTILAAAGARGGADAGDLRSSTGGGEITGGLPPHLSYRVADGYKVIVRHSDGLRRLFDLNRDPGEHHDLAGQFPEQAERLAEGLRAMPSIDPDLPGLRERLRALGYTDAR